MSSNKKKYSFVFCLKDMLVPILKLQSDRQMDGRHKENIPCKFTWSMTKTTKGTLEKILFRKTV